MFFYVFCVCARVCACGVCDYVVPIKYGGLLSLRHRWKIWRCDENCVLTAM